MKKYQVESVELIVERAGLAEYLTEEILPKYEVEDLGHDINHVYEVLRSAYAINDLLEQKVDNDMLTTAVFYHDLGLFCGGRDGHDKRSAEIVRNDQRLKEFFSEREIDEIATACLEHRSSYKGKRNSLISKIVTDADTMDSINYPRIIAYYRGINPNAMQAEILNEMWKHYHKKQSKQTGYAKYDLPEAEEMMRETRELLWELLEDRPKFDQYMLAHYGEYLD
ncbi:MAG: HD domain-containing protein [Pseudomonadales bacterium]|jgi:HD superfamily phosphodiesterase|nr:HD domain-containing protein [Pseudomonadales bacterium]